MNTSIKTERHPKVDEQDFSYTGSPAVERVEMFRVDGQLFDSFEKALSSREDKVEAFLRPMFNSLSPLPPGDYIKAVDWILANRVALAQLLRY